MRLRGLYLCLDVVIVGSGVSFNDPHGLSNTSEARLHRFVSPAELLVAYRGVSLLCFEEASCIMIIITSRENPTSRHRGRSEIRKHKGHLLISKDFKLLVSKFQITPPS